MSASNRCNYRVPNAWQCVLDADHEGDHAPTVLEQPRETFINRNGGTVGVRVREVSTCAIVGCEDPTGYAPSAQWWISQLDPDLLGGRRVTTESLELAVDHGAPPGVWAMGNLTWRLYTSNLRPAIIHGFANAQTTTPLCKAPLLPQRLGTQRFSINVHQRRGDRKVCKSCRDRVRRA